MKYGFICDDCDVYVVESQKWVGKFWIDGKFDKLVVLVKDINGIIILVWDEYMWFDIDMQFFVFLNLFFELMGVMGGFDVVGIQVYLEVEVVKYVYYVGNFLGIVDGVVVVLIGLLIVGCLIGMKLWVWIKVFVNIGLELVLMLIGLVDVIEKLLKNVKMEMKDFDFIEINEVFVFVVLCYQQVFDFDL